MMPMVAYTRYVCFQVVHIVYFNTIKGSKHSCGDSWLDQEEKGNHRADVAILEVWPVLLDSAMDGPE